MKLVIDCPVDWDWNTLADEIDANKEVIGGVVIKRHIRIGRSTLSIAAFFGAHCVPNDGDPKDHVAKPLRDYTHVELMIISGPIDPAALACVVEFDEDFMAHYVEVAKLPLLINKMLSLSVIHVPVEERPDVIAHFNSVLADALEEGQYGRGGPGTYNYFSFSD